MANKFVIIIMYYSEGSRVPSKLKTAISPEVLWGVPKWTPETNRSVSDSLNWENCVYFHEKIFMSLWYFIEAG